MNNLYIYIYIYIYIVHLFFCESVESRVSRGKMIQKAPVAMLVMICQYLVESSLQPKWGLKALHLRPRSLSCTLRLDWRVQRRSYDPAQGRLVIRVREMLWQQPSRWGSQSQ